MDPTTPQTSATSNPHWAPHSAHKVIDAVRRRLNMSEEDLRIAHWSCGGNVRRAELSAFLAGERVLSEFEYNTLAAALNDRLIEAQAEPTVPYSDDWT